MKTAFLVIVAALLPWISAQAQYEVELRLSKIDFVAQEPMVANVTLTNRSGSDVILGAAKGKPWLLINVKDSTDRSIAPSQVDAEEPIVLRAGDRISRTIQVAQTHSITEPGTYSITASAYHPPSGEFYQSNRARFTVVDAKPYGKPLVFGVPAGLPNAGRVQRHTLMVHRDLERSYLYYRLMDDRTNGMLLTYQLAPCSLVREPQYTLDRENSLHVMFMCTPDQMIHYVIGADGKPKTVGYYRDAPDSRPQMFRTADNGVVVSGGLQFDPIKERAAAAAANATASKGRGVSDRPPGL